MNSNSITCGDSDYYLLLQLGDIIIATQEGGAPLMDGSGLDVSDRTSASGGLTTRLLHNETNGGSLEGGGWRRKKKKGGEQHDL